MALFGSMLLLPLYFQVARGESPLHAGLLVAPQGLGAAFAMRFGGRMTDRVGGGRVVLIGLTLLTLAPIPSGDRGRHAVLAARRLRSCCRGVGLGFTMMPAMAAAYATLERQQVPRATPMLNVVQRIGGSIGTAVLAVVLQRQLVGAIPGGGRGPRATSSPRAPAARQRLAEPLATAFAHTYWWALALTAVAFVPATVLAVTEGRERRARAAAGGPDATRARAPQAAPIAGYDWVAAPT